MLLAEEQIFIMLKYSVIEPLVLNPSQLYESPFFETQRKFNEIKAWFTSCGQEMHCVYSTVVQRGRASACYCFSI